LRNTEQHATRATQDGQLHPIYRPSVSINTDGADGCCRRLG
jgi:hypothetical protein